MFLLSYNLDLVVVVILNWRVCGWYGRHELRSRRMGSIKPTFADQTMTGGCDSSTPLLLVLFFFLRCNKTMEFAVAIAATAATTQHIIGPRTVACGKRSATNRIPSSTGTTTHTAQETILSMEGRTGGGVGMETGRIKVLILVPPCDDADTVRHPWPQRCIMSVVVASCVKTVFTWS
jgi:hypothetical protein